MPRFTQASRQAVESGQADIAFANSVSTVDGINGQPPFDVKTTQVCNAATLYPQYFQVVSLADSGITSPADFKGRSLATQPKGNTGEAITAHLLQAYGLGYADLARVNYGSYTDSVTLMKDGNAEIFSLGTAIPAGAVMDLASARNIKLIDIPDDAFAKMQALNPGYKKTVIPAGTYPKQTEDVSTIGYATHIIVRCDLDDKLVAGMLDSLVANMGDFAVIAKAMRDTTPESMGADIGVPLHPAAAKWYQDRG